MSAVDFMNAITKFQTGKLDATGKKQLTFGNLSSKIAMNFHPIMEKTEDLLREYRKVRAFLLGGLDQIKRSTSY